MPSFLFSLLSLMDVALPLLSKRKGAKNSLCGIRHRNGSRYNTCRLTASVRQQKDPFLYVNERVSAEFDFRLSSRVLFKQRLDHFAAVDFNSVLIYIPVRTSLFVDILEGGYRAGIGAKIIKGKSASGPSYLPPPAATTIDPKIPSKKSQPSSILLPSFRWMIHPPTQSVSQSVSRIDREGNVNKRRPDPTTIPSIYRSIVLRFYSIQFLTYSPSRQAFVFCLASLILLCLSVCLAMRSQRDGQRDTRRKNARLSRGKTRQSCLSLPSP